MKKSYLLTTVLTIVLSSIATVSNAGLVSYSDRATWQTAAGGGTGDIFDDLNTGAYNPLGIVRDKFTSTGTAQNAFPNGNPTNTIDGTGYIRYLLNSTNFGTLTFDAPIFALAFDTNPRSSSLGQVISVAIDGVAATYYTLPSTDVNGFVGLVSNVAFTTFTITTSATASGIGWHGVDNIEAFTATSVPVPATFMLFALSLLGLSLATQRLRLNK